MKDRLSTTVDAAAFLAREDDPGYDDRPTRQEAERDDPRRWGQSRAAIDDAYLEYERLIQRKAA